MKMPRLVRHEEYEKLQEDSKALSHAQIDAEIHKTRLKRFLMLVDSFKASDHEIRRREIKRAPYIDLLREYHKEIDAFLKSVEKLVNDE